jgi:hypothetical protein
MRSAFIRVSDMLHKLIQALALVVLFTVAAYAQMTDSGNNSGSSGMNMNMMPDSRRRLTPEQSQREHEIEREYRETVNSKIPDKKGSNDPWGKVRPNPASTSAAKKQQ